MRSIISAIGGLLIGAMESMFAISFAAIIFSGPLSEFLDRGIGMSMLGAAVMVGIGAILYSCRNSVMHPQDITAILIASAVAAIAAQNINLEGEALFGTVAVFIAITTLLSGIALWLLGHFRLSFAAKYIPYPVLGGFLASTGYLLATGGIGLILARSISLWDLPSIFTSDALRLWGPWIIVSFGMVIITRVIKHEFTLPVTILAVIGAFYLWLWLSGLGFEAAREQGLFLGPFEGGSFVSDLSISSVAQADIGAIFSQSFIIIAIVAMACLGSVLNLNGIELETGEEFDIDKDMRVTGIANLLAAPTGGFLGFAGLSNTILAHRLNLRNPITGLVAAAACISFATMGAGILENIPRGLLAAILTYLGLDLLYVWLIKECRRLNIRDYGIIVLTVLISATFGFLTALAVGFALATFLFVLAYASQDVVRLQSNLSLRRSVVDRDLETLNHLNKYGTDSEIIELTGYLFFGTVKKVQETVENLTEKEDRPQSLLLDFNHVQGIDPSAIHQIRQIVKRAKSRNVEVLISGLGKNELKQIGQFLDGETLGDTHFDNLDDGLRYLETETLNRTRPDQGEHPTETFFDAVSKAHPDFEWEAYCDKKTISVGQPLVEQGAASDELLLILSGGADVMMASAGRSAYPIAQLLPGSLFGEVGYFAGTKRTASVIANTQTTYLSVDRETIAKLENSHPEFVASFRELANVYLAQRLDRTSRLLATSLK